MTFLVERAVNVPRNRVFRRKMTFLNQFDRRASENPYCQRMARRMFEKSSVQTRPPFVPLSGCHWELIERLLISGAERAITTHCDGSCPLKNWGFKSSKPMAIKVPARRQIRKDRLQVQTAVGDVKHEDSALGELGEVKIERLLRDEMDGDRVGAEGIEDD